MTALVDVESATGTTLWISADIPATFDQTGYEDTGMDWTEVGEVEDVGAEDSTKATSDFTPVKTAITTYLSGAITLGERTITIGRMPADTGQAAMLAAFLSPDFYSFKIVLPDGELRFFHGLVTKYGMSGGKAGDVIRSTAAVKLCKHYPVQVLP